MDNRTYTFTARVVYNSVLRAWWPWSSPSVCGVFRSDPSGTLTGGGDIEDRLCGRRHRPDWSTASFTHMLLAVNWGYWKAGKIHAWYEGWRSPHTNVLHWRGIFLAEWYLLISIIRIQFAGNNFKILRTFLPYTILDTNHFYKIICEAKLNSCGNMKIAKWNKLFYRRGAQSPLYWTLYSSVSSMYSTRHAWTNV